MKSVGLSPSSVLRPTPGESSGGECICTDLVSGVGGNRRLSDPSPIIILRNGGVYFHLKNRVTFLLTHT